MTTASSPVPGDALRISPNYTSTDWYSLDSSKPTDWPRAADMLRDRLYGRFLRFADECLDKNYSGFMVLSIDCLLAETLQQFRKGVTNGHGQSRKLIKEFLSRPRFQPDFDATARKRFYEDIRCGLLHQAEAKAQWLIRRRQPSMLQVIVNGPSPNYILDVRRFHEAMQQSLADYCAELQVEGATTLRSNLWSKMDAICSVRTARGAVYPSDASGEELPIALTSETASVERIGPTL